MHAFSCRRFSRCFTLARRASFALAFVASAAAQDADQSWWQQARYKARTIMKTGTRDLYLAGYSYHGRRTYSSERLSEFNELTWGGGVGKSIRNKDGNEESLFAMLISDSHYKPQPMLGYSYEWIWRSGTPDGKWAQA